MNFLKSYEMIFEKNGQKQGVGNCLIFKAIDREEEQNLARSMGNNENVIHFYLKMGKQRFAK